MIYIGLEIHIRLKSNTKLFSRAPNVYSKDLVANTATNPVDIAYPGTLPSFNPVCLEHAIALGLALNMHISPISYFERKSYSYPDLPKGYQVTQEHHPVLKDGIIILPNKKIIRIKKAHLEEDAAKLIRDKEGCIIDHNRAGAPLIELVTYPDIHNVEDAIACLKEVHYLIRHLGISDGDMSLGCFRADVNVSIGTNDQLGSRQELKNLNSFVFARQALEYEIDRLNSLKDPEPATRGFCQNTKRTFLMRSKEEAGDYLYLPDPDIPPIVINKNLIDKVKKHMALIPSKIRDLYVDLKHPQIDHILDHPEWIKPLEIMRNKIGPEQAYKWMCILKNHHDQVNWNRAVDLIQQCFQTHTTDQILKSIINGSYIISVVDINIKSLIVQILENQSNAVKDYQNGKLQALASLIAYGKKIAPEVNMKELSQQIKNILDVKKV